MLVGIKVYVSPDYCVIEDGLVNVYDWKAGKTLSDATDAQLACYALYASQTWGVKSELLRLVGYNLYHDVIKEHHCDGVDFRKVKEQIFESVVKMKSLLMDAEGNIALEIFGVFPQVLVAFTGIAIYTWDVAFRAATVVGFFGARGMGWYLKRNVLQVETERVAAILLSIIILVLVSELIFCICQGTCNENEITI